MSQPDHTPRIGLLEDDPIMAQSLVQRLSIEGYRTACWTYGEEALQALRSEAFDLLIFDVRLPDMSGVEVFDQLAGRGMDTPVIVTTAFGDIDEAVSLMRRGAVDYVTKPFEIGDFLGKVSAAITSQDTPPVDGSLGPSAHMRALQALLERISDIDSTVLLTGESGVGKEVAARFLHTRSHRAASPFVAVNCAAIPADLIESELFGHTRGAFTGATASHRGYLERAGTGTLFLDEIGDLPPVTQTKLLRVLQDRRFTPVGSEQVLHFPARVIAATHADLEREVEVGRFREDLFFRLNVIPVVIAPLRERREDIAHLLSLFVREFTRSMNREQPLRLSQEARASALEHVWRGNVRELRNRVERAVALCRGPVIMPHDLFPERELRQDATDDLSLETVRDRAERQHIISVLEDVQGRVATAAGQLGISRTTLWEKMRRLGITRTRN